jgi:hypothetical protein
MSELDICIGELRNAAKSLNAVADSLTALFSGKEDLQTNINATFTQTGNENMQVATALEPKPITLEEVRAVLAEKSRAGHTTEVRELLEKHGATKLSEIAPDKYPALLKEAEALGNG